MAGYPIMTDNETGLSIICTRGKKRMLDDDTFSAPPLSVLTDDDPVIKIKSSDLHAFYKTHADLEKAYYALKAECLYAAKSFKETLDLERSERERERMEITNIYIDRQAAANKVIGSQSAIIDHQSKMLEASYRNVQVVTKSYEAIALKYCGAQL
tara:strand:- start:190 stop:654 length:465 start_codon:yes stop_codon:yes gene_type:complete